MSTFRNTDDKITFEKIKSSHPYIRKKLVQKIYCMILIAV